MATVTSTGYDATPKGDQHSLKKWMGWLVLLVLGVCAYAALTQHQKKSGNLLDATETSVAVLQSNIAAVTSNARLVAHGDTGSIERLNIAKTQTQEEMNRLRNGGSGPHGNVMALGARPDIPFSAMNIQLENFNSSIDVVSRNSELLLKASRAQQLFQSSLEKTKEISQQISGTSLNSGAWANALSSIRQDLTRSDLSSVTSVLSSTSSATTAQQWVALFRQRSQDLQTLNDLATRDQNLGAKERELIKSFLTAAEQLAQTSAVLQQSAAIQEEIRGNISNIEQTSEQLTQSAEQLARSVRQLDQLSIVEYFIWGSLLIAVIGLMGVSRSLWVMGYTHWSSQNIGQKNHNVSAAVERTTRELRKIINLETDTPRLVESPDSQLFALVSLINKVLDQRHSVGELIEDQGSVLLKAIQDLDGLSRDIVGRHLSHKEAVGSLQLNILHMIEQSTNVRQKFQQGIDGVGRALEIARHGGAVSQENIWKIEELRENTQSTAKRIKRLGEGAQNINASADLIQDVTRKVKVLALNLAVEAASQGEHGRHFSALAQELERLAQNIDTALKDIGVQIDTIQTDSKDTVSSMELAISDVVNCAKMSSRVGASFKELDQNLSDKVEGLQSINEEVTESYQDLQRESVHMVSISQDINKQEEQLHTSKSYYEKLRPVVTSFRTWLNSIGRDIH